MVGRAEIEKLGVAKEFMGLRDDVRHYLGERLESREYYSKLHHKTRDKEYLRFKEILSKLCGLDAPPEKLDSNLYDRAINLVKLITHGK